MLDCISAEHQVKDIQLNQAYGARMQSLSPSARERLRTGEREWLKLRERRCQGEAKAEEGGTLASVVYSQCLLDQTTSRVTYLRTFRP